MKTNITNDLDLITNVLQFSKWHDDDRDTLEWLKRKEPSKYKRMPVSEFRKLPNRFDLVNKWKHRNDKPESDGQLELDFS